MAARFRLGRLLSAASELVLGSVCAGCEAAPGLLCGACREQLLGPARLVAEPAAGLQVAAAAAYGGVARATVLAHKEQGRLGLSAPLGDALAIALVTLLESPGGCPACGERTMVLVPVPSARRMVRRRGHDPMLRAARRAATVLRRVGYSCTVVPALRHRRRVADQAGLDAAARRANLDGALMVRLSAAPLLTGRCLMVVDDVVTTGATLSEAARALAVAGSRPCGAAVMTATAGAQRALGVSVPGTAATK